MKEEGERVGLRRDIIGTSNFNGNAYELSKDR